MVGLAGCFSEARASSHASVIMTIYNPISVTLKATKPDNGGEAEGNCVAVRRGGEQPKAKKQSQIHVNSIRFMPSASLLAIGEASVKRDPCLLHHLVTAAHGGGMYGWSENASKDVYVNGESYMDWQQARVCTMQQSEPPYELRSLVTRMEQREVGK